MATKEKAKKSQFNRILIDLIYLVYNNAGSRMKSARVHNEHKSITPKSREERVISAWEMMMPFRFPFPVFGTHRKAELERGLLRPDFVHFQYDLKGKRPILLGEAKRRGLEPKNWKPHVNQLRKYMKSILGKMDRQHDLYGALLVGLSVRFYV